MGVESRTLEDTRKDLAGLLANDGWHTPLFIDQGGMGIVYLGGHPRTKKEVALKVLIPDLVKKSIVSSDGQELATYAALFEAEVQALAALSHRCLMEILDTGSLTYEGLRVPYFVMPFKTGAANLYKYLEKTQWHNAEQLDTWLYSALRDVLLALDYMHEHGRLHRDVKGNNVIVDALGYAQLTDLGSAKEIRREEGNTISVQDSQYLHPDLREYLRHTVQSFSDPNRVYLNLPRELLATQGVASDLYALGETIAQAKSKAVLRFPGRDYAALDLFVQRLRNAGTTQLPRYESAKEVLEDLPKIDPSSSIGTFVPELAHRPSSTLRIAPELSVPVTRGITALLDSPLVRRLRTVNQLALANEVYPSANHTRFEHSLGVMYWARQYLYSLWHDPADQYVRLVARPEHLQALLIGALVHDLGQYPFAHAAEGVDVQAFSHEKLGALLLNPDAPEHSEFPTPLKMGAAHFRQTLSSCYPRVMLTDVLAVLEKGPPSNLLRFDPNIHDIFSSILNGPIDADKADYVVRDALFTGLGKPSAIADTRFLSSLTVTDSRRAIALRPSGRDGAETMLQQRYRLFKWVYWHRTVRAIECVLMAVIDELVRVRGRDWTWQFKCTALGCDESQLLAWMYKEAAASGLNERFQSAVQGLGSRTLYTRILTIGPAAAGEDRAYREEHDLYTRLIRLKNVWASGTREDLKGFMEMFRDRLGVSGPADVLIDIPIPKRHDVGEVHIREVGGKSKGISASSHIWRSVGDDFEHLARRVRVFAHPDVASQITQRSVLDCLNSILS